MKVEFLRTTADGQESLGTVSLVDGALAPSPSKQEHAKGLSNIIQMVLTSPDKSKRVNPKVSPEEWLAEAPKFFSGSYLRAKIL